jgi:nicotianamine synthase
MSSLDVSMRRLPGAFGSGAAHIQPTTVSFEPFSVPGVTSENSSDELTRVPIYDIRRSIGSLDSHFALPFPSHGPEKRGQSKALSKQLRGPQIEAPPEPLGFLSPLELELLKEQLKLLPVVADVPTWRTVATRVCNIHDALESQRSLAPSTEINRLFTELVHLTDNHDPDVAKRVLSEPEVQRRLPSLRNLCARGESALEHHWYERVVGSVDAREALQAFPYYRNYEQLAQLEMHAMLGVTDQKLRRVLFIGSGPLPLTSILLAQRYDMQVDNIDIDSQAATEGAQLATRLGAHGLTFAHATVDRLPKSQIAEYDVVYVAALAGLSHDEKDAIFRTLAASLKSGALIIARSAHLQRELLYPAVSHMDMQRYFRPLSEVHPYNEVVNSVLIARKD